MTSIEKIERPKRKFLPENFTILNWDVLKPYFDNLLERSIKSANDLRHWFRDRSELESIISEDLAWRYIHMTCYTENEEYSKRYEDFVVNIQPQIAPVSDKLNKKAAGSQFLKELEKEIGYDIMIRNLKKDIEIFRNENVPLYTEITTEQQKYAQLSGAMMVQVDGKEMTLQQASVLLMSIDRSKREDIYHTIANRRLQDKEALDDLFTKLISLRDKVSANAGFGNFRDYMFRAMGRFDYTPKDCFDFHESIQSEVVPILNELASSRKAKLKVTSLKPWDKAVDPEGREALKAFEDGKELTEKTITCFQRLDPYLGQCLSIMRASWRVSWASRSSASTCPNTWSAIRSAA